MDLRNISEEEYNLLPTTDKPVCLITGDVLTYQQNKNNGKFKTSYYKRLKSKLKTIDAVKEHLKHNAIYSSKHNMHFKNIKGLSSYLTYIEDTDPNVFNAIMLENNLMCKHPGCNHHITTDGKNYGTCSVTHTNQLRQLKKGTYSIEGLTHTTHIDHFMFPDLGTVAQHLVVNHNYTIDMLEDHYNKHYRKDSEEGKCKHCKKPTKFNGLVNGYDSFCHNTDCNVRWYNANTDRLEKSAEGIKKSRESGDCIPTQLGYWIKQGYTEDGAKRKLKERQTTNTVESIMSREGCTLKEAQDKRKAITEKWSSKTHTGINYSKVSQDLFWDVWESLKETINPEDVFFATFKDGERVDDGKNKEYRVSTIRSYRKLDFYIKSTNIIVEFDGAWFHSGAMRPEYADEQRDKEIIEIIPDVSIIHVSEVDYCSDKEGVTNRLISNIKELCYKKKLQKK